ncbi:MAG: hypothetical protein GQ564_09335 [Bacteroidales bacterium]|nr:hypothetical protein [Bacteroidales bacterium]
MIDDNKIKHLEFIQNIITRMNTNSFQIKNFAVLILTALLAVYISTKEIWFVALPIIPTIIFWFLDSYYLHQERLFRKVYNDVAEITKEEIRQEVKPFEIPINIYKSKYSYLKVFFSKTIIWIYLPIVIALSLIFLNLLLCR